MAIWKTIVGFFTGGSKAAEKVVDMADKAVYTKQERSIDDNTDLAAARAAEQPIASANFFDSLVNGYNRLPRPAFATWALGELAGWWRVDISKIDPEKMSLIILIVTFYFAGRALLKDLPGIIKGMRQ